MIVTDRTDIKSVCFSGHRVICADFNEERLDHYLKRLIDINYTVFICGGALGFDTLVAEKIIKLKKDNPQIKLHIYAPCRDQDKKWSFSDKRRYKKILDKADLVIVMAESYYDGCMRARNYKMVDDASACICYLNNTVRSGTAQTVRYALKTKRPVINVSEFAAEVLKELSEK